MQICHAILVCCADLWFRLLPSPSPSHISTRSLVSLLKQVNNEKVDDIDDSQAWEHYTQSKPTYGNFYTETSTKERKTPPHCLNKEINIYQDRRQENLTNYTCRITQQHPRRSQYTATTLHVRVTLHSKPANILITKWPTKHLACQHSSMARRDMPLPYVSLTSGQTCLTRQMRLDRSVLMGCVFALLSFYTRSLRVW